MRNIILRLLYKVAPDKYYSSKRQFLKDRIIEKSLILDVGGGSGNLWKKIEAYPIILDIDYNLLKMCKGDCEKVCASACFYPFRERVFDVVVFHDSLHHFINPFKALREVSKIVKCNGRVMIFDFDKASLTVKLLALAEKLIGFPASFINLKHLVKYASKRGFRVIEYRRKRTGSFILDLKSTCET